MRVKPAVTPLCREKDKQSSDEGESKAWRMPSNRAGRGTVPTLLKALRRNCRVAEGNRDE